ncbi:MAG: hypothetical protein VX598_02515 [Verrucomicrobiota bacterium]|nr:hypothetical protein [Verrucomicrobiota bacterium]
MTILSSIKSPSDRLAILLMALGLATPLVQAAQVELRLAIPEAPFHVIGDPVPLRWEFINRSEQQLAFMWEGCCRLNGRVTASLGQVTLRSEPATAAAQLTAHRFARAARLLPGKPTIFETNLGDWLNIDRSGEYKLTARYTGLLDNQQPQVPRNWQLWKDSATAEAIRATLLTPSDYIARHSQAGLVLHLDGPDRLLPLQKTALELELSNTSGTAQTIHWPSDFALWFLDATGRRTPLTPTRIRTVPEKLVFSKNQRLTKRIEIDSGVLESRALGRYRLFVDFKTATNRAPSNAVPLDWQLDVADLQQLIHLASGGAKTGLRNRPLKLMRLHLGELGQALGQVPASDLKEKGKKLLKELQLAASLKPVFPKPGLVTVKLRITNNGSIQFADKALGQSFQGEKPITDQLDDLLNIRKHLGWTVAIQLHPYATTAKKHVAAAFEKLKPLEPRLAKPITLDPLQN